MSEPIISDESRFFYQALSAMGKLTIEEKRKKGERMHLVTLGYKNARDQRGR